MKFSQDDSVQRKVVVEECTYDEILEFLRLCKLPEDIKSHYVSMGRHWQSDKTHLWHASVSWQAAEANEEHESITVEAIEGLLAHLVETED